MKAKKCKKRRKNR